MINLRRTMTSYAIVALGLLIVGGAPAVAQKSPVVQQMEKEIGTGALEYWTPRLNDYKNRIDQVLTGDDLAALNRLRIRWSVLLNEGIQNRETEGGSTTDGKSPETMAFNDRSMQRMQEVMSVFSTAKELGVRYRTELDRLGVQVIDDLGGFADDVAARVDRFSDANQQAIAADESARTMFAKKNELGEGLSWLRSEKGQTAVQGIYSFAVEPIVLLYDGTDLKTLLNGALPAGTPIAGMDLPDGSALAQNSPNPAAITTNIRYTLSEASSGTILRLFDATGEEVARYDQGSRPVGDHNLTVDVSSLATGMYVYHLTVTTPKGERVYSKVMQVVR